MRAAKGAAGVDLLTRVTAEVTARRDLLRAAAEEYEQLLTAVDALGEEQAIAVSARRDVALRAPVKVKAAKAAKAKAAPRSKASVKAKAPASKAAKAPKVLPSQSNNGDQQAILAALEHGSHTVAELTVVTAMSGPSIRGALKALGKAGSVTRTTREGKAAYVLAG